MAIVIGEELFAGDVARTRNVSDALVAKPVLGSLIERFREDVEDLDTRLANLAHHVVEIADDRLVGARREAPWRHNRLMEGDRASFTDPALPPAIEHLRIRVAVILQHPPEPGCVRD